MFPYVFPLITNYWSQNTAKIKFIGQKEGGMDKLKGKKIVNLYHDSAYGKETIPVLDAQAKKYGFDGHAHRRCRIPGNEQQSQWLQIRQIKPDWVILRGWGVMNPTALKAAAKVGFPRDKIVGVWWAGAEEDVIPGGRRRQGLHRRRLQRRRARTSRWCRRSRSTSTPRARARWRTRRASARIYYNRGVVHGILTVEAMRKAQERYGKGKPMTGEQVRWGLENLSIDDSAPEGARRRRLHAAAQGVVPGPRRRRRGEVPAVGRQASGR